MMKLVIALAAILTILLVAKEVFGMTSGIGKKQPFVIMSPFKAMITKSGKPLANALVKVHYSWNSGTADDEEGYISEHKTDSNGIVSLPKIEREIFISNIQTTASNYLISVVHDGEEIEMHSAGKVKPEINGEFNQAVSKYTCDIDAPYMMVSEAGNIKSGYATTKCNWKGREKLNPEEL